MRYHKHDMTFSNKHEVKVIKFDEFSSDIQVIIDKFNERVGTLTLRINNEKKDIEMAILIYKGYSGRSFGTKAWLTTKAGLIKFFGSYRIWAGTLEENIAMIRLLQKSGFHLISKESQDYFSDGQIKSVLFFESSRMDMELNESV